MARKFETDYRVAKTSEILPTENKFRLDVDLRLDAVELALQQLGSGADTLVARVLRVIEQEIAPRAAEIEALLTDYRAGVPAASVEEEADGRQFLTPARRAAILDELRGDVDSSVDTLAKLLASISALNAAKAPLADAHLTGAPTAPTVAGTADNSTRISTTAFVQAVVAAAIAALKGDAAAAYDTIQEIAARLSTSDTVEAALVSAIAARVRIDAAGDYSLAQMQQARANIGVPGENLIFNPDFRVNQRGYVSGATLASGAYGHDGWKAGAGGGNYTFTQLITTTQITIASGKSLIHVVEDRLVEGGAYVLSWEGSAQARVGVNSATPSGSYAASPIVVSGQTAGTTMSIEFGPGTVGKVKLEAGQVPTAFAMRKYKDQLNECRRYCRWFPRSPAKAASSTSLEIFAAFEPPMRIGPTLTLVNGTNAIARPGEGAATISAISSPGASSAGAQTIVSVSGLTAQGTYFLNSDTAILCDASL